MQLVKRELKKLRSSRHARAASWMMAGQGASVILQGIYFVALARLLGPREYGIYVGAFAFTRLVMQYSPLGSGIILLRYVSVDRKAFARYLGNIFISTLGIGSVLIALLSYLAPHLLNHSSASLVCLAAICNCLFAPLTEQMARVFQCFEKMRVTAILNLLTNLTRTLAVAGMLWHFHRASAWQWTVASSVVSATATVIAVVAVTRLYGRPRFDFPLFRNHALEGLGYSFASSTMSIYNDVDKTILSHEGLNAANGIYSMAYRVVDMATIPVYSIREAVMPRLFQFGNAGLAEATEFSYKLLRRALPFSIVVAGVMFLAAPLIPLVAGAAFTESVVALRWLCLIPVFRCIHIMIGSVLTGAGLQRYRTVAQLSAALLNVSVNLWAIPRFQWLGAAWASLLTDGALCLLMWGALRRLSPQLEAVRV